MADETKAVGTSRRSVKDLVGRKVEFTTEDGRVILPVTSEPWVHQLSSENFRLHIQCTDTDVSYDDVKKLMENIGDIEYYEKYQETVYESSTDGAGNASEKVIESSQTDWELKNKFIDHTCGKKGFTNNYKEGTFFIEMPRKDENLVRIEKSEADITEVQMAVAEIAESLA